MPKRRTGHRDERRTSGAVSDITSKKVRRRKEDNILFDKENNDGWPYTSPIESQTINVSAASRAKVVPLKDAGTDHSASPPSSLLAHPHPSSFGKLANYEGSLTTMPRLSDSEYLFMIFIATEKDQKNGAYMIELPVKAMEESEVNSTIHECPVEDLNDDDMEAILSGASISIGSKVADETSRMKPWYNQSIDGEHLLGSRFSIAPLSNDEQAVTDEILVDPEISNFESSGFVAISTDETNYKEISDSSDTMMRWFQETLKKGESCSQEAPVNVDEIGQYGPDALISDGRSLDLNGSPTISECPPMITMPSSVATEDDLETCIKQLINCPSAERKNWYTRTVELARGENQEIASGKWMHFDLIGLIDILREDVLSSDMET